MAKWIRYVSDVSAGTFKCADCGHTEGFQSATSLPPCPNFNEVEHVKRCWYALTGKGDAPEDPYTNR